MDNTGNCENHGVTPFEYVLKSLPIYDDLKKEIIEQFKQLDEDRAHLSAELSRCRMKIDRLKSTIVTLAIMIPEY